MRTYELTGAELDYWVAKAEGYELDAYDDNRAIRENGGAPSAWNPSTNWMQGGPIIERERIDVCISPSPNQYAVHPERQWKARAFTSEPAQPTSRGIEKVSLWRSGPTPMIAAMRAYIASKGLGDEMKFSDEVEAT